MKKSILIIMICVSLLLTACGSNQISSNKTEQQPYSITTETFVQNNIKIQYPQIEGLTDQTKEKTINDLIKNDILESQIGEANNEQQEQQDLTLDLECQVTMNTSELLSVMYTGSAYVEGGAFPTNVFDGITVDLKNATKLYLSNITTIDTDLVKRIKQSTLITNDAVRNNGMDKNVLISFIQSEDNQTLLNEIKDLSTYNIFYITPNSLVISVNVPHALGDYALVELSGQYDIKQ